MDDRTGTKRGLGVVGAAAYLACSWTWCIGMWLPVLLAGDFGWLSWVVFALPNVIGATAVGFVLRTPEGAWRLAGEHRWAMVGFSVWTVLFHAAFLGWFLSTYTMPFADPVMVGFAVLALIVLFASLPLRAAGWAAVVVWLGSVGLGVAAWMTAGPGELAFALPPLDGTFGKGALAMAAPVIAFGFLLCPFLDATLVGVRGSIADSRKARVAFAVGFGVLFLTMIAMTLGYAGRLIRFGSWSYYILPGHVALQAAFTVGVHMRALGERGIIHMRSVSGFRGTVGGRALGPRVVVWTVGLVGAGYALAMLGLVMGKSGWMLRSGETAYSVSRLVYDSFLGGYALVFPAYVWTVVLGRRWFGYSWRAALTGWGVSVVIGMPMMVLGAIVQWHGWLVGVVVVGLGGMVVARVVDGKARVGKAWRHEGT